MPHLQEYYMDLFSGILSRLSDIDSAILLFINSHHSPLFDTLMWGVSDKWIWIPLYLILAIAMFRNSTSARCCVCILSVVALMCITDQLCASVIRPMVCRLRPSTPDNPISAALHIVNGYHGGRYGFPSCHAANTFALAVFLSLFFRRRLFTVSIILWSLLISYSRIYLGVHYPADILAGYLIGGGAALLCYRGMTMLLK